MTALDSPPRQATVEISQKQLHQCFYPKSFTTHANFHHHPPTSDQVLTIHLPTLLSDYSSNKAAIIIISTPCINNGIVSWDKLEQNKLEAVFQKNRHISGNTHLIENRKAPESSPHLSLSKATTFAPLFSLPSLSRVTCIIKLFSCTLGF